MNAINRAAQSMMNAAQPLQGAEISVGEGFSAQSFRARDIGPAMDPLVMVDHYVMTEPTFGEHPHAGMSAVSLLFDDSEGLFHNRDSLGNDFDLEPGDLYWLKAARGAVHDESPRDSARTHGLQVFINLPSSRRFEAPASLLVRAKDMPVIHGADHRVRVALGESNGKRGAVSPALPMTILDGTIESNGHFSHEAAAGHGVWIQAVEGNLSVFVDGETRDIPHGQALALGIEENTLINIKNVSGKSAHFAMFDGQRVEESFVQDGPFVMSSKEQIADIKAAYDAGHLGSLNENH